MLKRSLAVLAAVSLLSLAACSDDGDDDASGESSSSSQPSEATSQPSGASSSEATTPASGSATCTYTSDGSSPAKDVEPPPTEPSTTEGLVPISIETNVGEIKALLSAKSAPCTVNSFLSLADQDYFDGTSCHRLTTQGIFVLQCGDPTGTGAGGPGYSFADELTGNETYPAGTIAMANAGPDTNGSQFFLVYQDTPLPANYTVFGRMDAAGIKVVEQVAAKGTNTAGGDGPPKQSVTIDEIDD